MTDALPLGWTDATLEELVHINPPGASMAVPDEQHVSFVPMAAVEALSGRIDTSGTRAFGEVKKGFTRFLDGDVLFAKITPCMENGKIAVARGLRGGVGCGSTEFHVLRSRGAVLPDYLRYFLVQSSYRQEAERNMQGAVGQRRVPTEYLRQSRMPTAPIGEQQRIVSRIEELFSEIDEGERALERVGRLVERYRQSVLKAAVTGELTREWRRRRRVAQDASNSQSADLPCGWTQRVGRDLFKWASGDFLPAKNMISGPIPVFGGNGVNGSHCEPNVSEATIVIGRVGVHCGNVHITSGLAWITDNAIYARRWPAEHNLKFLALILRDARLGTLSQGGAQPFVNQKVLNETVFRLPPRDEQDRLVDAFEVESARLASVEASLVQQRGTSATLRQSILKAAFSGQLVPQDPRDEPASALLARLAAQASAASPAPKRQVRKVPA